MQTMTQALIAAVLGGSVDQEVAASAAPNRHDFMIALDRALKEHAIAQAAGATPSPSRRTLSLRRPSVHRAMVRGSANPAAVDVELAAVTIAPALAIGSFLNVVAARVPLRRSIVVAGLGVHVVRARTGLVRQRAALLVRGAARTLPPLPRVDLVALSGGRGRHRRS